MFSEVIFISIVCPLLSSLDRTLEWTLNSWSYFLLKFTAIHMLCAVSCWTKLKQEHCKGYQMIQVPCNLDLKKNFSGYRLYHLGGASKYSS